MTHDDFHFSRDMLRRMNGSTPDDVAYLRSYRDACVAQIEAGAQTIHEIADGQRPFDAQLLALLRAQVGRVRFHSEALDEAAFQFKLKPDLARLFAEAFDRVEKLKGRVVAEAQHIEACFEQIPSPKSVQP